MTPPRVTMGVPVHNGERYLAAALDSLLAQTFTDFEILISDNASTDSTAAIAGEYARRDPRIHVERNEENLGAAENFNRLVARARGEYFKWATDDDLIDPGFLAGCVDYLDGEDDAVLCFSEVELVDASGRHLGAIKEALADFDAVQPHRRFANLILVDHRCFDVFGLIRTAVLRETPCIAPFVPSDRVLLAELGLRGRLHRLPAKLFFSREHPGRSITAMPALHLRAAWFDPSIRGPVFPYWRLFAEYGKVLHRVPLPAAQRARCRLHLLRWLGANWNWVRMVRDLVIATTGSAGPLRRRKVRLSHRDGEDTGPSTDTTSS